MRKFSITIVLLIFLSCGIKQPVIENLEKETGSLYVSSYPSDAIIYLDYTPTGKKTPDTLFNVASGQHCLQVFKEKYRSHPDSFIVTVITNKMTDVNFELEKITTSGSLGVFSNPPHAEILIDGQTTAKFTPDTLILEQGLHHIELQKNGYSGYSWSFNVSPDTIVILSASLDIEQRVLLEAFGNVSCTPCVESANNLDKFMENNQKENFAILEYYASWPSPNDPFYKTAPEDVMARVMFYGVTALPNIIIGGVASPDAISYNSVQETFDLIRSNQNSQVGLSIEKVFADGLCDIRVQVYNTGGELFSNDLKLFVGIVEDGIQFDSPPGSNGLTNFDFVFRGFLSSSEGETLLNEHNPQNYTFAFNWPDWDYSQSKIVAFIQNIANKQIVQTTIK